MIRLACLTCAVAVAVAVAALTWAFMAVQPSRGSDGYQLDEEPVGITPGEVFCGLTGCDWHYIGGTYTSQIIAYSEHAISEHSHG